MREPGGAGQHAMSSVAVAEELTASLAIATPPVVEVPPAPRFMSEDEENDEETVGHNAPVFASVSAPQPAVAVAADTSAFDAMFENHGPIGPARPRFSELCEEPAFKPLPRDYATDLGSGVRPGVDDRQPIGALFADKSEEADRDLEVPTFMRRLQF
jgi:hypothetical protein